jgi:cytoskeletal protein RodZ
MERQQAAKLLQALADGIDPATGDQFPIDSPYQRADTVRALFVAIQTLGAPVAGVPMPQGFVTGIAVSPDQPVAAAKIDAARPAEKFQQEKTFSEKSQPTKSASAKKAAPANAGRPWSQEEDLRLAQGFDAGRTIESLAEEYQRSRWAVEARLVRLEKIPATQSKLRYPLGANSTAPQKAEMPMG